jgi:hypothetical protein
MTNIEELRTAQAETAFIRIAAHERALDMPWAERGHPPEYGSRWIAQEAS